MNPPLWLRRAVRPLIPDRLMARFRLRQHSLQVRTNVDLFVDDPRRRRRWLATTPDTYRVRRRESLAAPPAFRRLDISGPLPGGLDPGEVVVLTAARLGGREVAAAVAPLGDGEIDASALALTAPPRLVGRRRVEPRIAPLAIALRAEAWNEVSGTPPGDAPLPGLWDRLVASGRRLAVVPWGDVTAGFARTDPISGPVVVIFAVVPMHDIGGGSRAAQMALELLRRGYQVIHVALFGTAESLDLGVRFVHPRLEQVRASDLDVTALLARLRDPERMVIVQAPARRVFDQVRRLQAGGCSVIYDLIDDWSAESLGGEWFEPEMERRFIEIADSYVASAPDLVRYLEGQGAEATLVPNAVNDAVFGRERGAVPDDFPPGEGPVLGYHGSLYGDWFDWEALASCAAIPDGRVVVIGDRPSGHPPMPDNVHFLGLKPHQELPDYVGRFDVGLIPFRVDRVTHAVSPLKAFEYLASGVPVAAPPLRSLEGIEGIHTGPSLAAAATAALAGDRPDRTTALRRHSWGARLAEVWKAAGHRLHPVRDPGARTVLRPPLRFSAEQRRL